MLILGVMCRTHTGECTVTACRTYYLLKVRKEGFFTTENGILAVTLTVIAVGAFIGFVGAWAKRDRIKALEQYNQKQKIGKNKNKKQK